MLRALLAAASLLLSCHLLLPNGTGLDGAPLTDATRPDRSLLVESGSGVDGQPFVDGPTVDRRAVDHRPDGTKPTGCSAECLFGCDGAGTCRGNLSTITFAAAPPACPVAIHVGIGQSVDTSLCQWSGPACPPGSMKLLTLASGTYCVVHVSTLTIAAMVTVIGQWPLVILADGDVTRGRGGRGGLCGGGGGGGSGGYILLESPAIQLTGMLASTGGAGGGGSSGAINAGAAGQDGPLGSGPAIGGSGWSTAGEASSGGHGAVNGGPGLPASNAKVAAGGGGGAGGRVRLRYRASLSSLTTLKVHGALANDPR